jgi:hypothetical protein
LPELPLLWPPHEINQLEKPNLSRWDWSRPPRCICYQLITRCQLINKKIKRKVVERHGFVHVTHETLHLSQWRRRHFELHCGMQFVPHHGSNKGESLQDLKVGHKCNESP